MPARVSSKNRRRRWFPALLWASAPIGIALIGACTASTSTSLEPTPSKCAVTPSPPAGPLAATGGPVSVAITAFPECTWTAATQASWITGLTPTSGQGNGEIKFTVVPNSADSVRQAEILLNDVAVRLMQEAAPAPPPPPPPPPPQPPPPPPPANCTFAVAPLTYAATAAGASGVTVSVTAPAGCAWTSVSGLPWLTVTSGAIGNGTGTMTFAVAANTSSARTGTITVAGRTVTVSQASPCAFAVAPTLFDLNDKAKTGLAVLVTAGAGCSWTAVSHQSWITVTSGASGTGAGTVVFRVEANSTNSNRIGTLTVAGITVTVRQDK